MTANLKRLLALLAVLGLLAAACGGSSDDASGESSGSDTSEEGGTDGGEPVALTEGGLLATVQARGTLLCGIGGTAVAFSETQPDGTVKGIDADYCRAVAAAVLGDANAVEWVALTAAERFTAIQTGDADVLMRTSTWTQSRDSDVGMDFGPTTYYDGQQVLGRSSDGFSAASQISDIDGAVVCTQAGTTTEKNIKESAEVAGATITLQTYEDFDAVMDNFLAGSCDLITSDGSALVGRKVSQQPADQDWAIFPATPISKEPLGPVYGQNDSEWADVINWVVYATIIADEKGITMDNVDDMAVSGDAEVIRLLGGEGELQTAMGLDPDAFLQVIKAVGNYDEIYTRNLVPVGLVREGSANASYLEGGLIYAPPAR